MTDFVNLKNVANFDQCKALLKVIAIVVAIAVAGEEQDEEILEIETNPKNLPKTQKNLKNKTKKKT